VCGPFDNDLDGQRDSFAWHKYSMVPQTGGFELLGGFLEADVVDAAGLGIDSQGHAWFVVLRDTSGDGVGDVWQCKQYHGTTGALLAGFDLDNRFVRPGSGQSVQYAISLTGSAPPAKVVGVGIEPDRDEPWVLGWLDSDNNGVGDRWEAQRYTVATGTVNLSGTLSSDLIDVVGGTGVGLLEPQRPRHWLAGTLDSDLNTQSDTFYAERMDLLNPTWPSGDISFHLDAALGSLNRNGGYDSQGRFWTVGQLASGPNTGRFKCARYNPGTQTEDLGYLADADFISNVQGVGLQAGTDQLFIVGKKADGFHVQRYDNGTGLPNFNVVLDPKFLDARGVGVTNDGTQVWVVGAYDSDANGQRDEFRFVRHDTTSGTQTLSNAIQKVDTVDISGVGIDQNGHAWFVLLRDRDSDGAGDLWECQQESGVDGAELTGFQLDPRFVLPPPAPPSKPGDLDNDGDVDGFDIQQFEACGTGPGVLGPPASGCPAALFNRADFDGDQDADGVDFAFMQRCISGSGIPSDPDCAD
ncbi:MAG: hypothetical protein HY718_01615, partial [Planctomycetes bacterium]|nr:hypothetical protein [Planctomycetota bacterium]